MHEIIDIGWDMDVPFSIDKAADYWFNVYCQCIECGDFVHLEQARIKLEQISKLLGYDTLDIFLKKEYGNH